jgi:hypothetical protein
VTPDLARWQRVALVVGTVGVAVCAAGLAVPDVRVHVFRAWLVAFCLTTGVALGSLVVLMLQYLTGGDWGFILRRPLEAATRTLPLAALFYLPIAFALPYLYEWADPAAVAVDKHLQHKALYLNVPFALARAAVYFGIWNLLAWLLNSWSRRQDTARDMRIHKWCENLSAPGMVLYVVTITFASIDWAMSLEPEWYSTIYGAMFGMGQVLSGFAFCIAVLMLVSKKPEVDALLSGGNLRDLGSLLLAFVMVWAYLSFSQFLLIWSGNLPEEVPWYVYRLKGGWQYLGLLLVVFHFALPFVLLLSTDVKRDRTRLAAVALLVLGMRAVDLVWLIVPAFHHHKEAVDPPVLSRFIYLAAVVGVGGLWFAYYLRQLQAWPLAAAFKPYAEGGAHGAVTQH